MSQQDTWHGWTVEKRLLWFKWDEEMGKRHDSYYVWPTAKRFEQFELWYARKRLMGLPLTITEEDLK